jgi:gluconolactonase
MIGSREHAAGAAIKSNPIDGFTVQHSSIAYTGEGLQRPECILAECDGSLWAADARGGVVHIRPDGSQRLVTQRAEATFAEAADDEVRFIAGTLPNGLAFARNGDVLISNFGTDRLEVMTRDGETRVLVDTIDGEPIGKVNFVLRDSRDRLWLTISTRTKNWMRAMSPAIADGFVALYEPSQGQGQGRLRIVADGFHFTNEIRLDAREEWLYVAETCARRVTRLRVQDDGSLTDREIFGPADPAPSSTASRSTPTAISGAPT